MATTPAGGDDGEAARVADEIGRLLVDDDTPERTVELTGKVRLAGAALDSAVDVLERRGLLARLLPASASTENADLLGAIVDGMRDPMALLRLALAWLDRGREYDRVGL